ncbi:GNAT family N-acetyltransferase [Inconstantimicrobium mannanitabidum]|uniref:Uncharacterized protein n=1 Tax=Inconstantimicrobium mannanitabidum TaxID=1604901 RepID=A0ACB5R657_9CLOT|nr:GNAT family N-acetyltransferase [Clostridium sp. TW13]GKX64748.1 hypothetical protein rsdtw13_00060 [Clostridium sp. TW13]
MVFRLATESDLETLAEMRWQHEYEETNNFNITKDEFISHCKVFLKEGLESNTWVYWIAEEEGSIIANIYVNRIRKVPKPQKLFAEIGYITNVHTKEEYRNKGTGTELLNKVKHWAVENEIELLFLWPSKKSVNYYERQGFSMKNEILELEL